MEKLENSRCIKSAWYQLLDEAINKLPRICAENHREERELESKAYVPNQALAITRQFVIHPNRERGTTMSLVRRSNVFDPFALDLWDPIDNMFRSIVPAATSGGSDTAAFANARIDWKETPEAHVFKADLPGVKKEEVKVEVEDGNVLVISGERTKEKEDKSDKWHRVERSSGKFVRRFRLPENGKVEQVKAGLENGVLTVTVPKAEVKKPQVKAIEISG